MAIFHTILNSLSAYRYVVVFVLAIVEGPLLMITSGFLLRGGEFALAPLYFSLMAGDFVADMVWYVIGRFGAGPLMHKVGPFFNITPEIIAKIEKRFKAYQNKILFISKITMGFGFALATLLVAGMLKVPVKQYALFNLVGGFIWTAILLVVGYFFGNIYFAITGPAKIIFLIISATVIIFGLWAMNRYLVKTEL